MKVQTLQKQNYETVNDLKVWFLTLNVNYILVDGSSNSSKTIVSVY